MSEVVLKTIVEKLEALQIALLKDNNPVKEETIQAFLKEVRSFRSEMEKLPSQFEKSTDKIPNLLHSINALNSRLDSPLEHQIKHKHHLNKGILIIVGLFMFCCVLVYCWYGCYKEKNAFEANDIKYRYLKVNGNTGLLKAIYSTDSLYSLYKRSFVKKVIEKERDLASHYELSRIAGEKKEDSRPRKESRDRKVHKGK